MFVKSLRRFKKTIGKRPAEVAKAAREREWLDPCNPGGLHGILELRAAPRNR